MLLSKETFHVESLNASFTYMKYLIHLAMNFTTWHEQDIYLVHARSEAWNNTHMTICSIYTTSCTVLSRFSLSLYVFFSKVTFQVIVGTCTMLFHVDDSMTAYQTLSINFVEGFILG